jgi:hypothetical protein
MNMMEAGFAGENSRALMRAEYVRMAKEAFAEAKAEIAVEIKKMKDSIVYPPSMSEQDVRMHCISLAMGQAHAIGPNGVDIGELADIMAQYVLTGKKSGAEG